MAELKTQVNTFLTDYICDECGDAAMAPTGKPDIKLAADGGSLYPHMCPKCGYVAGYPIQYPFLTHENIA